MRLCLRCRRANPDEAAFCHHDGIPLTPQHAGDDSAPRSLDWHFPGGKRCTTIDEFARGCLTEWNSARTALRSGQFVNHFTQIARTDLARVASTALDEPDEDVALQKFLEKLPGVTVPIRPLADPVPRRLNVDDVGRDQVRLVPLRLTNRSFGYLHGTITVVEGDHWLWIGEGITPAHSSAVGTRTEQEFTIQIDPTMLPAAGSYLGRLRIESNGGNLEVPVQANLVNRACSFMGRPIRSERELARLLRDRAREAGGWLRDGLIQRWYIENGWEYPLKEEIAPQLGGVQQFFEALGISPPPEIRLGDSEIKVVCVKPEVVARSVVLTTREKKWIYAFVESDDMWLRPLASVVSGPQSAEIAFEIDSGLADAGAVHEGVLRIRANGGQRFVVNVRADVRRPRL
jgi:hypothetical protein